jgi:hypothetical protein
VSFWVRATPWAQLCQNSQVVVEGFGSIVRMSDAQVSVAARQMAAQRWGSQRLVRLVRELELRVAELPPSERVRLQHALAKTEGEPCSAPDPTPSRPPT